MTDACHAKQRTGASHRNSNYIKSATQSLLKVAFSSAVSAAVISGQIVALS
jgi:hypothetical protein